MPHVRGMRRVKVTWAIFDTEPQKRNCRRSPIVHTWAVSCAGHTWAKSCKCGHRIKGFLLGCGCWVCRANCSNLLAQFSTNHLLRLLCVPLPGLPDPRDPNFAHFNSHFAQKRTLLHKTRKNFAPKPKNVGFYCIFINKYFCQTAPKFRPILLNGRWHRPPGIPDHPPKGAYIGEAPQFCQRPIHVTNNRACLVKGVRHGGVSTSWNTVVLFNCSQEQPGKKRLQHICQLHHDGGLIHEVVLWRAGDDSAPGGGAHGLLLFQQDLTGENMPIDIYSRPFAISETKSFVSQIPKPAAKNQVHIFCLFHKNLFLKKIALPIFHSEDHGATGKNSKVRK